MLQRTPSHEINISLIKEDERTSNGEMIRRNIEAGVFVVLTLGAGFGFVGFLIGRLFGHG